MEDNKMFWDKNVTKGEARNILKDESNPRFIEYAALLLSRMNDPKAVFNKYIGRKIFCRQWRRIKKRMRTNKWGDNRIVFWDEVYKVVSKRFDKGELRVQKEKRAVVDADIGRIGKRIREARKSKGWTQNALAERSGFSQQTISFVESGYINISFLTLKKIAGALDLRISVINKETTPYSTFTM